LDTLDSRPPVDSLGCSPLVDELGEGDHHWMVDVVLPLAEMASSFSCSNPKFHIHHGAAAAAVVVVGRVVAECGPQEHSPGSSCAAEAGLRACPSCCYSRRNEVGSETRRERDCWDGGDLQRTLIEYWKLRLVVANVIVPDF